MRNKEFKITEDALQALFQGKKVVFREPDMDITLYPPRYGVFITHEKRIEIERMAYNKAFTELTDLLESIDDDNLTH